MNRQQFRHLAGRRTIAITLGLTALTAQSAFAQSYRLERIASGLAQPTFLAQAPGDPANIIYYSTRITAAEGTGGGFGTINDMGSIYRYDMNTRTSTEVMNLSHRQLVGDEGLVGFAFNPDFNIPGAPGYQKLYVSSSQYDNGASPIERVEEYTVNGPGGTVPVNGSGHPIVSRLILEYTNVNTQQNHTVNWVGFDPMVASLPIGSPERNYLYIAAGDGDLGGNAQSRPEQKANSVLGKVLRVDVDVANHGDAYPGDSNKNFAIPETNPITLWNSIHSASEQLTGTHLEYTAGTPTMADYTPALGEIYFTGVRNTFRMSIDRQTGDYWMGDVGENSREEVNFLKAGTYDGSQPPVDFGYAQREGTIPTGNNLGVANSSGDTSLQWDLSGGSSVPVDSTNPIREGDHSTTNTNDHPLAPRSSYIGGYVYRGPISELQGNYFYADFVHSNVFMLSDFNRNTPLSSYSGTNFNQDPATQLAALGSRTTVASADINSLWNTLIFDPTDPTYTSSLGTEFGIGRVVSFGEDNSGNLYVIDMGGTRGDPSFGSDYPNAGRGQIFMLAPNAQIKLIVDRDTGKVTLENPEADPIDIRSYSLNSSHGSIDPDQIISITGNYDANPPGDGSIDGNDHWEITSPVGSRSQFAEQTMGDVGTLPASSSFPYSAGGGWTKSIYEDLQFAVTLGNGSITLGVVEFIGNGGQPFQRSDLNFNGELDPGDWPLFRMNHLADLSGLTAAQSYQLGDLDGDGDNDFADFRLFQADYIAANGAPAFAALLNVPEPGTAVLVFVMCTAGVLVRRREIRARDARSGVLGTAVHLPILTVAALFLWGTLSPTCRAGLQHRYSFTSDISDSVGGANGTIVDAGAAPNFTFGGGLIDLSANTGQGSNAITEDAYVDLPNGIFSSAVSAGTNGAVSLEFWATVAETHTWQRFGDFGTSNGGEDTSPAGDTAQYVLITPNSGRFTDGLEITNHPASNAAEPNVGTAGPFPNGVESHVVAVYDHTNTTAGSNGTMTLYLNGALIGTNQIHPDVDLRAPIDNNNWLGRSQWNDPVFDGSFNEFRMYDQALEADQIAADFAAGPDVVPELAEISLEVNTITGRVRIKNSVEDPTDIDYYRITSTGGALDPAHWNSLDDQNIDAIGDGEGQSWDEADGSNSLSITELFLLGASGVSSTDPLQLGQAFDVSIFEPGADGDLKFQYAKQGSSQLIDGSVMYVTPGPLSGDYNHNGTVDAADFVVWRDSLGSTTVLDADGDGDGKVDQFDYIVWRNTFGNSAGSASAALVGAVPESASVLLLISGACWSVGLFRQRGSC